MPERTRWRGVAGGTSQGVVATTDTYVGECAGWTDAAAKGLHMFDKKAATPVLPPPRPPTGFPPQVGYSQLAQQRVAHTFEPPKGYKIKKKRRWPWVVLALVVVMVVVSAVNGTKDDATSSDDGRFSGTPLVMGGTGSTSGLDVTMIQAVDPWTSTNQFESPEAGHRFVAVELNIVNTTGEPQTFSTMLGLEIVDSLGRRWDPAFAGFDLPQLDGEMAAGTNIRGWQVFEVGADATGLQLDVKGSLTASGIRFIL